MSKRHPVLSSTKYFGYDDDSRCYFIYYNFTHMMETKGRRRLEISVPTSYSVYDYVNKFDEFERSMLYSTNERNG